MENFTALSLTCKHLNTECRDDTYTKLKKQKHAAHTQNYRLKQKNNMLQVTTILLTNCWLNLIRENEKLRNQITQYIEATRT